MTVADFIEGEDGFKSSRLRSGSRNIVADLRQACAALTLVVAGLLCLWSVNDFRTSLSLLHSAANLWPRAVGRPIHGLAKGGA